MVQIMIDLETMGTGPDAPIVAIGAVAFSLPALRVWATGPADGFYASVDLGSAMASGGIPTAGTIKWWLQQDDAAQEALFRGVVPVRKALEHFDEFIGRTVRKHGVVEGVWGNGAAFDNVILRRTYERAGMEAPWKFYQDRCYRTVLAMARERDVLIDPMPETATKHNAFDDALYQARTLVAIHAR